MRLFRKQRLELWLFVATLARERALNLCVLPEDADTVQKIHDSMDIWLKGVDEAFLRKEAERIEGRSKKFHR